MRIIAGDLKGRKLIAPQDNSIRPTSDKVKEAIFSMVAYYLEDSIVIDLFSGTGSLGLEAVSRGAKRVYFGDKSKKSIEIIKRNILLCEVNRNCILLNGNWEEVLKNIHESADLIFLDPPYNAGLLLDVVHKILDLGLIKPDGIIVAEHGFDESLPESIGYLEKIKTKKYGSIGITLYAITSEDNNG